MPDHSDVAHLPSIYEIRGNIHDLPDLITKFVSKEFHQLTLDGLLKFGTLHEYRSGEQRLEARLKDREEGIYAQDLNHDVENFDGSIGPAVFKSLTTRSAGTSIRYERSFEALVFCSTADNYSEKVHKEIVAAGNPSLTHYVEFHAPSFLAATEQLISCYANAKMEIVVGRVRYLDEPKSVSVSTRVLTAPDKTTAQERYERAAFCKSAALFNHEREFRITAVRDGESVRDRALFVTRAMESVARAFRRSIVSYGSLDL